MDDATRAQLAAADPAASTWLSANAGSGKTRVLTDRVARLLLNGVDPENILCLTYTKAAASEMQNRLFKRLGEWAMLDEPELLHELAEIGEHGVTDPARARTLFARAIETPGGLRIQTIHAFCTSLLRRFPLEAGVTPRFRELDEGDARRLADQVLDDLARQDAPEIGEIATLYSGESLADLALAVASQRDLFSAHDQNALSTAFDLPEGFNEDALCREAFLATDEGLIAEAIPILRAGTITDAKLGDALAALPPLPDVWALPALEKALLFGDSAKEPFAPKVGKIPTKATRTGPFAALVPAFDDLMERVAAARPRRLAFDCLRASRTLHRFASVFRHAYERAKTDGGVLDFDDLIVRARALLTDPAVAQWVLYRLDGGIDHILVDEAQDTSPAQWSVIMALAEEMSSGRGARDDRPRTIFVVGDKKQSIYSFQGADPTGFDRMADDFESRLASSGGLARRTLDYSFRSSPAILRAVDAVFSGEMRGGLGRDVAHRAFHEKKPGRVDLWRLTETEGDGDPPAWFDPVDTPASNDPNVLLADRIAADIARKIEQDMIPGKDGALRPVTAGDVLILVQGRSLLFHQMIRACKERDLPIAGADRLKVAAQLAVRDLIALLSFLALPEDDLSLAAALRSPLFGWTERQLYDLAQPRDGYLWQALRRSGHVDTVATLRDLRRQADFLRPFELIDLVLTRHGARRRLIARLGHEAEDGIDELLSQALTYEMREIPTLAGFVSWMQAGDVDVKRQSDSTGSLIRVMTVHGAKGLEAPIVYLPDTMRAETPTRSPEILLTDGGVPVWNMPAKARDTTVDAAFQLRAGSEAEERRRLLYVAMTRAESWLVVGGVAKEREAKGNWYDAIAAGLDLAGAVPHDFDGEEGLRLESGYWTRTPGPVESSKEGPRPAPLAALPDAAPSDNGPRVLSPSDLGGAKVLPGGPPDPDATSRGTAIHRLLELLPDVAVENRATAASEILGSEGFDDPDLVDEALTFLDLPDAASLFDGDALTEVEVTATGPEPGTRLVGTIDRLVIRPDRLIAIDWKTNREVPEAPEDIPEGLLRQMGAYLHQLEAIFPGRPVELVIGWTHARRVTRLPHGIVRAALSRTPTS